LSTSPAYQLGKHEAAAGHTLCSDLIWVRVRIGVGLAVNPAVWPVGCKLVPTY